jgi:hypothetical protein
MSGEGARTEALPRSYAFIVNVSELVDAPSFTAATAKSGFAQPAVGPLIIQRTGSPGGVGRTRVPSPFVEDSTTAPATKTMRLMKKSYKMLPKTNTKPQQLVRLRRKNKN